MQRVVSSDLLRTFTPPRELARSRPREVRLSGNGRGLLALAWLLVAAAIGVGAALHVNAREQSTTARQIAERGVAAMATVDRLWRKPDDGKPAFAAFHFDAAGTRIHGESRMWLERWRSLGVGANVPVRYLPEDPRQFVVDGARVSRVPPGLPYVFGGALAIVALLCGAAVRRQRRLLMEGRPAPAVVTAVRKHHSSHGGTHREMSYEFPLLGGGVATGKSNAVGKGIEVGSAICIVYDPDVPTRSHPYPFSLVKLDAGTTW